MRKMLVHFLLCFFFHFICLFVRGDGLIFLQETASIKLPNDFPVGVTFYRLLPFIEISTVDGIEFRIIKSVIFPDGTRSGRWLFSVDEHTGSLMLSPHRRKSIAAFKGSTFALVIVAVPSSKASEKPAHATIMVTVTEDNSTLPDCHPREEICFSSPDIQFQLPETIPKGFSLGSLKPIPYSKLCPNAQTRYTFLSNSHLAVTSKTGALETLSAFDYEEAASHEWNVSCEVRSDSHIDTFHAVVQVLVLDVDDNAPFVQNSTNLIQEIDASQITPGNPLPLQLTVLDPDSASVNDITVHLMDPLKLFYLRDPVVFHGVNRTHMLVNTALVPKSGFHFPDSSYNVSVIFNDTQLINQKEDSHIVFHVLISNRSNHFSKSTTPPKDFQVVANIFRHSAQHARIVQPMEVKSHEGYFFRLLGEPEKGLPSFRIFGVTPSTGIIYLKDEVALSRSTVDVYRLELTWRSRAVADRKCIVLIRVVDTGDQRTICGVEPGHHFPTCATHGTAENCTSSCGRGSADGFCKWRPHSSPNLVTEYATCSPHLKTCPDGICDELELLDPFLCPQDCAEDVRGEAVYGESGKGIGKSAAPCTCSGPNSCICLRLYPFAEGKRRPPAENQIKISNETHTIKSKPVESNNEWSECHVGCKTMIVLVSLTVSGLVAAAGILLYRRYIWKSKNDEFPTITTPLNPSTQTSGTYLQDSYQCQPTLEANIEFPRDKLILEEVLGEGEFGKVVKGKAQGIADIPGLTTVAVKMLKDGSSSVEKNDLLSELNLLKEIHHPNVIQLLGACTAEEGPLYLIMEYAEHGSLINYLRKLQSDQPDVRVDIDDLLSFALQVAKGMDYLASMKVVHRDLAARNILVASGKVLKISDFGLSRDIYVEDTYRKSTKGRVPVKWMALESLQNNIYTTKSDVWSYGVLLWEIITVGGSPYPGIPTEKLFQLLKDGYRMPKPDECPYHLYKIMRACWREKPNERPQFKELVQKIESLQHDLKVKNTIPLSEEECVDFCKMRKHKSENSSMVHQLASFPKLSVVQVTPYENQCLLSPSEFSV